MKEKSENENKLEQMWNGYCPESHLKGKKVRMRLNHWDFYESEETGLQMFVYGIQAVILNFRGEGKFRSSISYGEEIENSQLLSPQNMDMPPFNDPPTIFKDSEEAEAYINSIK